MYKIIYEEENEMDADYKDLEECKEEIEHMHNVGGYDTGTFTVYEDDEIVFEITY